MRPTEGIVFRRCSEGDYDSVYFIINEAAASYQDVIPDDFLTDPYMSREVFRSELAAGVDFWGYQQEGALRGVMGTQRVQDVMLIRHAYVRTEYQSLGVGSTLLGFLLTRTQRPVLVGTWAAATRAIAFYERHGFSLTSDSIAQRLLGKYWDIPAQQATASVVLASIPQTELDV